MTDGAERITAPTVGQAAPDRQEVTMVRSVSRLDAYLIGLTVLGGLKILAGLI